MRLVDADSLKDILEYGLLCNIPADSKDSEIEKLNTWIQEIIDKEPTVVPQKPILNEIRAEIAEYGSIWVEYKITGNSIRDIEKLVSDVLSQAKKQVLDVIDKHLSESEN